MKPPVKLTGEAAAFWKRHAKPLTDAGILTDADLESFVLLCRVWDAIMSLQAQPVEPGDFRTGIQVDRLMKQYHAYAKQFGLLPLTRKNAKMERQESIADVLTRKMGMPLPRNP